MNNIDNMLAHIINKDEDGFADAFAEEMKERLATSIIDKNLNISKDLVSDNKEIDSETVEEAVSTGNKGFAFKNSKDMAKFVEGLGHIGIPKKSITQNKMRKKVGVDFRNIRDAGMQKMVTALAKDLKANLIKESVNIIDAIKEALATEFGVSYTLKDSENIHILPEDANSIIQIHDILNADNQAILRDMLSETEESYHNGLDFCIRKAQ